MTTRTPWQELGACIDRPDVNWYPGRGESVAPAIKVCRTCPVQAECLEHADRIVTTTQEPAA